MLFKSSASFLRIMLFIWAVLGLLLCRLFSRCTAQTPCDAPLVMERSLQGAWAQQLWHIGLVALQHVDLSRPRVESMSPELASAFFTTEPPGKSESSVSLLPFHLLPSMTECWILQPSLSSHPFLLQSSRSSFRVLKLCF